MGDTISLGEDPGGIVQDQAMVKKRVLMYGSKSISDWQLSYGIREHVLYLSKSSSTPMFVTNVLFDVGTAQRIIL